MERYEIAIKSLDRNPENRLDLFFRNIKHVKVETKKVHEILLITDTTNENIWDLMPNEKNLVESEIPRY